MTIARNFLCEAGQLISLDDYLDKFATDLFKALQKKMPSRLQLKMGPPNKSRALNRFIDIWIFRTRRNFWIQWYLWYIRILWLFGNRWP